MTGKILIERSALEQALDALQDAETIAEHHQDVELRRSAMEALRTAMEQPQVEQEPVAWQSRMRTKWMRDGEWWPWRDCSKEVADDYKRAPVVNDWEYESRALYTHPQPRHPLTDEQIDALAVDDDLLPLSHLEFARAIERAHGIGGDE